MVSQGNCDAKRPRQDSNLRPPAFDTGASIQLSYGGEVRSIGCLSLRLKAVPSIPGAGRVYSRQMDVEARIQQWLQDFPANELAERIGALEDDAGNLERKLDDVRREISRLRRLSEIRDNLLPALEDSGGAPIDSRISRQVLFGDQDLAVKPKRRRDAVMIVFDGDREKVLHIDQIHAWFVERGWLGESENERHALQVTLSKMFKAGELIRPRMGFYQLAPAASEQRTDDDSQQEGAP
jgi:hypothetical protein